MIHLQSCQGSIGATLIDRRATGRSKVLREVVADIGFRSLQGNPIGTNLRAGRIDRDHFMTDIADPVFGKQLLNDSFRLVVITLAELVMTNAPSRIDEIKGRPILVVEGTPYGIVRVDCDRVVDFHVLYGRANVVEVFLERELRCVDTDHDQSLSFVFLGPRADIGKCASPVDARVSPEVDEDDFSAQAGRGQWLRIEPTVRATQGR